MATETEIKLPIADLTAFLKKLRKLGAKPVSGKGARIHEENVIFDTPQGGLAQHGQLLRIRVERGSLRSLAKQTAKGPAREERVMLTFKSPAMRPFQAPVGKRDQAAPAEGTHRHIERVGRHKVREETEVEVADAQTLREILQGLGLKGWFRYEKYRTTYAFPASVRWATGLLIELDEVPIGTFVELEGPSDAIDRAATALGFSPRDYITKTYLQLYVEDCRRKGVEPRDMVFPSKTR